MVRGNANLKNSRKIKPSSLKMWEEKKKSNDDISSSNMRSQAVEFLIQSAHELDVTPIVKYTALSLFADRFLLSLPRFQGQTTAGNWLLQPMRLDNLQLFSLISLWISSKIYNSRPPSVKILKPLGDKNIKEQHFTTRDYLEAVLDYEIGAANIAFVFLENLLVQFKAVAKVGELVNFEACMDIMDLLYETEATSILYSSPHSLAAAVLVASYLVTVPKQKWEFPILSWVKLVTSCKEEDIIEIVGDILKHVFGPS